MNRQQTERLVARLARMNHWQRADALAELRDQYGAGFVTQVRAALVGRELEAKR